MEKENKVTSIEDLAKYSEGAVVELPPFAEGQPFIARLKRPSLLHLIKNNCVPNELLQAANSLFEKGSSSFNSNDEHAIQKLLGVIEIVCEASFIEPLYSDIKNAGIELTDDQLMFVFGYAQHGVRQLKSFRK